ncbi:hypothetical protein EKH77_27175 [Streptomyces luteoverticillatus]|uniref:Uncharacterized protein n=1 Tax=Streptomyces luteoverticillatus TaxID=66425 RepID=A0A3Q9FZN3_STRLT|nr:hypothetical protein [Streptomyces luteoverticillatus]AZQ74402.1 hypothetical protein EKH77_27175 [Streptomyces luteoverticillatus]
MTRFSQAVRRAMAGVVATAAEFGSASSSAALPAGRATHTHAERPCTAAGLQALYGSENRTIFNAAWETEGLGTVLGVLRRRHAPATSARPRGRGRRAGSARRPPPLVR